MSCAVQNPHADSEVSGISKHNLILFSFLPPCPSASALMNSPYWSHRVACHTTLGTDYLLRAQPAKKHLTLLEGRAVAAELPTVKSWGTSHIHKRMYRQTDRPDDQYYFLPSMYIRYSCQARGVQPGRKHH